MLKTSIGKCSQITNAIIIIICRHLEQDLVNGPLHCFGFHSKCNTDFCKVARERKQASTADDLGKVDNNQNDAQSSCESSDEDDRSSNIPHTSTGSGGADDHDGPSCSDLESKCTYLQKEQVIITNNNINCTHIYYM